MGFFDGIFNDSTSTAYAKKLNLLNSLKLDDEMQRRAAEQNLLSGQFDAKPAGMDTSTGIDWNQARPEDKEYKRNLLSQINPDAAIANENRKLNPAPAVFQKFGQGEQGGMVNPQTGEYSETVKPSFAPPKIPDILIPGVEDAETRKAVAAAQAGRQPKDTWRRLSPDEAAAAGLPKGGTYEVSSDGQTRAVVAPTKEMGPGQLKLAQAEVGANGILYALDDFEKTVRETPDGARMGAMFGGLTENGQKLNTAWTNAALLAKGEALYNLGVLSGPDLDIIQRALPDPSTRSGALKDKKAVYAGINKVRGIINNGLAAQRQALSGEPVTGSPAPPNSSTPGAQPPAKIPRWNPKTMKFE